MNTAVLLYSCNVTDFFLAPDHVYFASMFNGLPARSLVPVYFLIILTGFSLSTLIK